MMAGRVDTVRAIAKRERVTDRYVSQLIELAFVDPRIVQEALAGPHDCDFDDEIGFQN